MTDIHITDDKTSKVKENKQNTANKVKKLESNVALKTLEKTQLSSAENKKENMINHAENTNSLLEPYTPETDIKKNNIPEKKTYETDKKDGFTKTLYNAEPEDVQKKRSQNLLNVPKKLKSNTDKVTFNFPFTPYPSQKLMIKTLVSAFLENKNAIIESPTGTGKTLTICAAIDAYLDLKHDEYKLNRQHIAHPNTQKFFILSRTHTQIAQIHKCLNQNFNISTTTLGSRKVYCLKGVEKDACKQLRKEKKCEYFNGTQKLTKRVLNNEAYPRNLQTQQLMAFPINLEHPKSLKTGIEGSNPKFDIESIMSLGKSCKGCPYYSSRDLNLSSVITLAPYNYLFDPMILQNSEVSLVDSIIIIDEAHNIDSVCREAGSISLTQKVLENMQFELYYYMKKDPKTYNFLNLLKILNTYRKHKPGTFTGEEISIEDLHIGDAQSELKNIKDLELNCEQILTNFMFILGMIKLEPRVYSLKVEKEGELLNLDFYLHDPSIIFNTLKQKARSIVLLSGTMSPFELIKSELQLNNCGSHIMPHVLDKNRLKVFNITKSSQDNELKGVYANINESWFITEIIDTIIIARTLMQKNKTKGGILIFVPSYNLIKQIREKMKLKLKCCFYESDDSAMDRYRENLSDNPALIAVYRGKLSEGMDFKDDLCRVLVAVGVPYPQINDMCIIEKRKFNDCFSAGFSSTSCRCETEVCACFKRTTLPGRVWYEGQALKAVNQAIGRIIRHNNDFGIVLLLDSRWNYLKKSLSKWIRESIVGSGKTTEMIKQIDSTFIYFNSLK
ncbi:Regulator of telomere elongation helicase 1 like protein [Cucumispora dikerogammari]|nr:Regulator of telomere elongation helicase 1 like protein [Cucumispora dikerogammari]